MCLSVRLIALIATLIVHFITGVVPSNLNPPPLQHGQWLPRIDSETSNYYQDRGGSHLAPNQQSQSQSQSNHVEFISSYPQPYQRPSPATNYRRVQPHQQYYHQQNPSFHNNPAQRKIISPIPEPKPRHDELKEKLGFNLFSSLLPTSILNSPQSLQQQSEGSDSENAVELDNNSNENSQYMDDSELHQDPPQESYNHPALLSASLAGGGNTGNEGGNSYRQPSLFSGQFQNTDVGGTSQEMDADPEPFDANGGEDNGESEGNIFTRIRNIIPFGSGLLSGLRSNSSDNGNMEVAGSNEQDGFPNSGLFSSNYDNYQDQDAPSFNPFGGNSLSNPFSIEANQPGLSNGKGGEYHESGDGQMDEDGTGSAFNFLPKLPTLPSLPNPIQSIRDALSNLSPSSSEAGYEESGPVDITQQISLVDPLSSGDTEDSTATPLQSIADGSLSSVLGPLLAIIAKLTIKYKALISALPWLKVGGVLFGPVYAAALAAMIIGIIYIAIYVPAWAIRLEELDGEMFILPFQQVMDILGIPDPIDALFNGRSMSEKNVGFGLSDLRKKAFLAGTPHETGNCMERFACELIGRKWLQRPSWKDGYIARGVKSVSDSANRGNLRIKIESGWPSVRATKAFLEAVATGLTIPEGAEVNRNSTDSTSSTCRKYSCDPTKLVKTLLTMTKKKNIDANLENNNMPKIKHDFSGSTTHATITTTQNSTIKA